MCTFAKKASVHDTSLPFRDGMVFGRSISDNMRPISHFRANKLSEVLIRAWELGGTSNDYD